MSKSTLDRFDKKLLEQMASKGWVFSRDSAQEQRMYDLWCTGKLARTWTMRRAGPTSREYRWAYRLVSTPSMRKGS